MLSVIQLTPCSPVLRFARIMDTRDGDSLGGDGFSHLWRRIGEVDEARL